MLDTYIMMIIKIMVTFKLEYFIVTFINIVTIKT